MGVAKQLVSPLDLQHLCSSRGSSEHFPVQNMWIIQVQGCAHYAVCARQQAELV